MSTCQGGQHDLVNIFESGSWDFSVHVVRWCQNCGCVVVDVDMDGRTYPGEGMKMRAPKILQANKNER